MSESVPEDKSLAEAEDALRAEVRRVAGGRPMTQVAKEADVAYGTWSAWMSGSYAGNTARVAEAARRWLDANSAAKKQRAMMPDAPGFIETPTASAIISTLEFAQFTPDFVLVTGGSGVGKTTALEKHQAGNPNVFILTCEPCFASPRMLLNGLGYLLGLREQRYSTMSRAIQTRLRGSGGLVIVDEAQHLNSVSLDQLRTLHDLAQVGVALVGNDTVYARMEGHSREPQFAQLYSRVGMRTRRPKVFSGDISMLLDAWGIAGADERKLLTAIAKKPGGLRGMTKALRLAHVLAAGAGVSAKTIAQAWERISSSELPAEAA